MRHPPKRTRISRKIAQKIYVMWIDHTIPGGYYDNCRISKHIRKVLRKVYGKCNRRLVDKYIASFRRGLREYRNVRWYRLLIR